jgi:hypothetical protein
MMTTNRILTGYCPLGSGSGPIGALLMGFKDELDTTSYGLSLILLNSWEWFQAALVRIDTILASSSQFYLSRLRDTSVLWTRSIVPSHRGILRLMEISSFYSPLELSNHLDNY